MAGHLTVRTIKFIDKNDVYRTIKVAAIAVIDGEIYYIPVSKKWQHYKLTPSNTWIIK
jgi:hypothetical protein